VANTEHRPAAAPETLLCVRRTLEWDDEALVEAGLRADFRPKVDAWNATFDLPYRSFRHRLKQIAQTSLARVENAACARLDDLAPVAIVVPVDDDVGMMSELMGRIGIQ